MGQLNYGGKSLTVLFEDVSVDSSAFLFAFQKYIQKNHFKREFKDVHPVMSLNEDARTRRFTDIWCVMQYDADFLRFSCTS